MPTPSNLYIILHKVRGEPAWDIARLCDDMGTPTDPGPWWIIPTSGHRAHPQKWIALTDVLHYRSLSLLAAVSSEWELLPDHYHANHAPASPRALVHPKPKLEDL